MKAIIFTDGSSRGNPGPGGWGGIVVEQGHVREIGGFDPHTTNNCMELTAVVQALQVSVSQEVTVYTDSRYVISGITLWIHGWKKNNWHTKNKTDVVNRDVWEMLDGVMQKKNVSFAKVSGHAGIPANERCDVIATSFADGTEPVLYVGKIDRYSVDIETVSVSEGAEHQLEKKKKNTSPAYSYVSCVEGVIHTDKTWEECKQRVHGVSGARFKKSVNTHDEKNIIEEFLKK